LKVLAAPSEHAQADYQGLCISLRNQDRVGLQGQADIGNLSDALIERRRFTAL
jgi:hypothetical protein